MTPLTDWNACGSALSEELVSFKFFQIFNQIHTQRVRSRRAALQNAHF